MRHRGRPAAAGLPTLAAVLTAVLTAGCGAAAHVTAGAPPPPAPLAASLVTAGGAWAIVPMGGSPAFWELVTRPAAGGRWSIVTPPGVATNGGLVVAAAGGRSLVAGIRPSGHLTFSPLAVTGNGGTAWSPGVLVATLADVPAALAASPGGQLLALLADGSVWESASTTGATGWSVLTSERALAATAGGPCRLTALTAVAVTAAGRALLGGACATPGMAGIFVRAGGGWRATGPVLAAPAAGLAVTVLRLAAAGGGTVALLAAGSGQAAHLLAAWTRGTDATWQVSAPFTIGAGRVISSGFGAAGEVVVLLSDGRALAAGGPAAGWRPLPAPPAGTLTLVADPAGGFDALSAVGTGTKLTDWRLDAGAAAWRAAQAIDVPVQSGSPG